MVMVIRSFISACAEVCSLFAASASGTAVISNPRHHVAPTVSAY